MPWPFDTVATMCVKIMANGGHNEDFAVVCGPSSGAVSLDSGATLKESNL